MGEDGLDSRIEEAEVTEDRYGNKELEAEYEAKDAYPSRETKDSKTKLKKGEKGKSKSRLESIVRDLKEEASKSGIDETEYISAHLAENIANYKEDNPREIWEGAVSIIYNAKKGQFLIEEEYGKQAGKLRLIGGQREIYDTSKFETQAREIEEEVKEPAKHILLKYLRENGTRYDSIINIINGGEVTSDIFKIHISSPKDWEIVSRAQPTGGAGPFHVKTYDELWSMPNSAFEYDHGPIIKKFILEELVRDKSFLKHCKSSNYVTPIVSTNYNHVQSITSFNKYTPSLN